MMTLLDRLAQHIKNILNQKRALENENERLKKELAMPTREKEIIASLKKEKNRQYEEIKKLTQKIESLLK
jgi:regulator of replication initiation timing